MRSLVASLTIFEFICFIFYLRNSAQTLYFFKIHVWKVHFCTEIKSAWTKTTFAPWNLVVLVGIRIWNKRNFNFNLKRYWFNSIPLDDDEEKELIHFLYSIGLKKYDKPKDLKIPKSLENSLRGNLSVEVALAERHFYNCDYPASHQSSTKVITEYDRSRER